MEQLRPLHEHEQPTSEAFIQKDFVPNEVESLLKAIAAGEAWRMLTIGERLEEKPQYANLTITDRRQIGAVNDLVKELNALIAQKPGPDEAEQWEAWEANLFDQLEKLDIVANGETKHLATWKENFKLYKELKKFHK